MRAFFHFDVCLFIFVFLSEGRKEGRYHILRSFFEAEKFQCVNLLLGTLLRGGVEFGSTISFPSQVVGLALVRFAGFILSHEPPT